MLKLLKNKSTLLRLLRFWPPYMGAGVRVTEANEDFTRVRVEMGLHFWNKNYVGTHFGGSLYAMIDPFYMFMLIENLGPDYIVWDKAANIHFKKPGRGTVHAELELSRERIVEIREAADRDPKVEPLFQILIKSETDEIIAEVEKTLYVKRKK